MVLELDGGVEVLFLREQVHHLAIRPEDGVPPPDPPLDHTADSIAKPPRIEPIAIHERGQRFPRVEEQQLAIGAEPVDVESLLPQPRLERADVGRGADGEDRLAGRQPLG